MSGNTVELLKLKILWQFNNWPNFGPVYHNMSVTWAKFQYALRCKKHIEDTTKAAVKDFHDKYFNEFLKGVYQCINYVPIPETWFPSGETCSSTEVTWIKGFAMASNFFGIIC